MTSRFASQYWCLVGQGLRAELADRERLLSPVLFAVTILLLLSFAMGQVEESMGPAVYVAQTFIAVFLGLQVSFARLFEPYQSDKVFDQLRTYPLSNSAWFLANYTLIIIMGSLVLMPVMLFAAFLQSAPEATLNWSIVGFAWLALLGLGAVGLLLSTMTLKAEARQIIYPILYFPLTTPVLLAAVQGSLSSIAASSSAETVWGWVGLLTIFDIIYFTLGILLFGELIDDT